jgi:hypothetical protein
MGQPTEFGDAIAEARFIAGVIITDQLALPVFQEVASVLTSPGWSEVVNNGLQL